MNLWTYLDEKNKREAIMEQRKNDYFNIAHILWFKVLYDDVLVHLKRKMDDQKTPFLINCWSDMFFKYGACKALTSGEDIRKFERVAEAELRDNGYPGMKVKVYKDCILVQK